METHCPLTERELIKKLNHFFLFILPCQKFGCSLKLTVKCDPYTVIRVSISAAFK